MMRMPALATDELRALYEQYAGKIYTLAHYTLGSPAAAEDAVQTIFLKAFQSRERFRGEAAAGTWLWRIAVNRSPNDSFISATVTPSSGLQL